MGNCKCSTDCGSDPTGPFADSAIPSSLGAVSSARGAQRLCRPEPLPQRTDARVSLQRAKLPDSPKGEASPGPRERDPNDRKGVAVELHAWELPPRRRVRIATYEEAAVVDRADQVIAARSGALPRLVLDVPL